MNAPRVLSVGQCGYDHGSIARHLQKQFGATTTAADDHREAVARLHADHFDLVLVNRVTDADGSLGVDLIHVMKQDPALAVIPVMLVSNYGDAQAAAVELGALLGFGKAQLRDESTTEKLMGVLAQPAN